MTLSPSQYRESARVELPWPARELSPNARVHWTKKYRATKAARHTASGVAVEAKVWRVKGDEIRLTVTLHPPDKRARDRDNMLASLKPVFDGISDALGIDDRHFRIGEPIVAEPVKGGKVIVELCPVDVVDSVDAAI